jgi:hypothetical protein
MDQETRRARRTAAHTRLAQEHPLWELYGRPLVRPVAFLAVVLLAGWLLVSTVGSRIGTLGSSMASRWPWAVLVFVSLLALLWVVRRLRDPARVPRRYR